jgi:hypothetical protein
MRFSQPVRRKKGTIRERLKNHCRKIPVMSNGNWYMGDLKKNPSYCHPWNYYLIFKPIFISFLIRTFFSY